MAIISRCSALGYVTILVLHANRRMECEARLNCLKTDHFGLNVGIYFNVIITLYPIDHY